MYNRKLDKIRNNICSIKMREKSIKLVKMGHRKRKRKKVRKRRKKLCESTNTWQGGTRTHNITTKNRKYIFSMDFFEQIWYLNVHF